MAAASKVVAQMPVFGGPIATLALNYDDLLLAVTGMTCVNPSAHPVVAHIWLNPGNINKAGTVLAGATTTFPLAGAGIVLLGDLSLPDGWEIGLGYGK